MIAIFKLMATIKVFKRTFATKNLLNKVGEKAAKLAEIEREKGYRKDVQDINRDIGKHFDVQYSPTSEARRDIRVRYHLNSAPGSPALALSDLRTYLYSYLFSKTADPLSPGTLYISATSPTDCLPSLSLLTSTLGLPCTHDFTTSPRLLS